MSSKHEKAKSPGRLSPYEANTFDKVCSLQRDNKSVGDYWIITNGREVSLAAQKNGEPATGRLSIPRAQFNRLVAWYMAQQQTVRR